MSAPESMRPWLDAPEALQKDIEALRHPDYTHRQQAAKRVLSWGEQAIAPLIYMLEGTTHPVLRVRVAELLGQLGATQALVPLARALERDLDLDIRRAVREALSVLAERPVNQHVEALLPLLTSLASEEDRTLALEWLERIWERTLPEDRRQILALAVAAMTPETSPWKQRFQMAWQRLDPPKSTPQKNYLSLPNQPEELVKLLANTDYATRTAATAKLANLGEAALEALRQGLRSASYLVRSRCIEALGRLGHPSALPVLLDAWQRSEDLQGEVEKALRSLASALDYAPSLEQVAVLLKLVEVCRIRVPEAAVFAAQALVTLAHTHPGVRYRAALRWLKASVLELFLGVELDPTLIRLGKELDRLTDAYKDLPIPTESTCEYPDLPRPVE